MPVHPLPPPWRPPWQRLSHRILWLPHRSLLQLLQVLTSFFSLGFSENLIVTASSTCRLNHSEFLRLSKQRL